MYLLFKEEVDNNHHSVPFYDPEDPDFSKDPDTPDMVREGQEVCKEYNAEDVDEDDDTDGYEKSKFTATDSEEEEDISEQEGVVGGDEDAKDVQDEKDFKMIRKLEAMIKAG